MPLLLLLLFKSTGACPGFGCEVGFDTKGAAGDDIADPPEPDSSPPQLLYKGTGGRIGAPNELLLPPSRRDDGGPFLGAPYGELRPPVDVGPVDGPAPGSGPTWFALVTILWLLPPFVNSCPAIPIVATPLVVGPAAPLNATGNPGVMPACCNQGIVGWWCEACGWLSGRVTAACGWLFAAA